MIETKKVCRAFPVSGEEPFMALKDVSVKIPEKSLTILRGKSGSGKTTLLNIIGALDAPTSGEVFFGGRNITGLSDKERERLRRQKIGFVFQSVSLIPMMTVYENVEFALRLSNYKGDRKKRVEECLHLVGLGKRAQHMPQELSGGEQQRVAIARAIAHAPQVLFADEPTAELDTATSLAVIKLFKDLVEKQGVTIVMTTHDMSLMDAGDMVYTLTDGSVDAVEEEEEKE
ncbi:MAG: ABC transporter ATP-binding protein [Lachnospiraceae bacterium]|jgi:putative ABC transport system ATP-binding protein|nr:ABC transporter ATP-binding protein [Lachnospiraceae bacterium]